MKYIILFCIILFSLPALAQQDSIVYSKGVRTNRDPIWYKESFTRIGDSTIYSKVPFTDVDSLILNTLLGERNDFSLQYRQAKIAWEEQEKSYLMKLRQSNRQMNNIFKRIPDGPKDTLRGEWKLNGATVTIRNDRIGNKRITWYSQDVFEYEKEIFFRRGKRWVSDKSILSK